MEKLHLPCLRGQIGEWAFFSSIMKIRDVVKDNRIITVDESSELYSKNINEILQRELKASRINSLKNYLTSNNERFFSSLIVAIHQGEPRWSDFDIEERFKLDNKVLNPNDIKFIENKTGILTLSGNEQIFALDGQHRLKGLRAAVKAEPKLGDEDISLIFIIHNNSLKERTRRLFTVLNKYAEKPKGAELIILDEDDAASIVARKIASEHPQFKSTSALSNSNSGSIPNNDYKSLTTLVTIQQINKILFQKSSTYYRTRPSAKELTEFYKLATTFWNDLFKLFPEIVKFIDGQKEIKVNGAVFNRNDKTGGSLLLRPVGQVLIAKVYNEFMNKNKIDDFKKLITKIDFNLSGNTWKYIYWNDKMLPKNESLKKNLLNFLLNNYSKEKELQKEIGKIYESFNLEYKNHILPVKLKK